MGSCGSKLFDYRDLNGWYLDHGLIAAKNIDV